MFVLQIDDDEAEQLPPPQLGFRRVLAGIYTHTKAHIVAAPMSHYIAKKGTRFMFSSDVFHLPEHGLLNLVWNNNMVMWFCKVNGKQVTFHRAMHYIYRPSNCENTCAYMYFSEMDFTSRYEAERQGESYYEF